MSIQIIELSCIVFLFLLNVALIIGIFWLRRPNSAQVQNNQLEHLQTLQNCIRNEFGHYGNNMEQLLAKLSQSSEQRLTALHTNIDDKLQTNLHKTNTTICDIMSRLTAIDSTQKNLNEIANNIVSLQQILADKRSRGAFGEIQLQHLLENMLPDEVISIQHQFSTGARCDCLLKLPKPTGNIAIDAKFPLENFQKMTQNKISQPEKQQALQNFRDDVKKHIQDIASKYIIPGETADCALMFIPAEAVFAEIHSELPEVVNLALKLRVWLVSPTTIMAILTTVSGILKDNATKQHISLIKQHLASLAQDFNRFDARWQKLAKHIELTHADCNQLHLSAKKISSRFAKIEAVELNHAEQEQSEELC